MDKEKAASIADEYHDKGFNCAQSVFAALSELTGVDEQTALRVGGGFGGGLRCGEVCGAVSGAVMAISCIHPYDTCGDTEAKEKIAALTGQFTEAFKARFGCLRCADLKSDARPCSVLIKGAAEIVIEMEQEK